MVDNFEEARKFLTSIGCEKKAYQESKRELWCLNDVAGMGAMFLSASKEKELAWTYYGSPEGMFSHYLVSEAMLQGLADLYDHDKDNVYQEKEDVTIEEAFKYSQGLISTQSPTIYDNFFNDLLLGR